MPTIHPVDREALLAEIQAIPDGTIVAVNARRGLFFREGSAPFTVTGPIYTVDSGSRYVGDTLLTYTDDAPTLISSITTVRRLAAPSSAGLDVQRAATRAGMDLK